MLANSIYTKFSPLKGGIIYLQQIKKMFDMKKLFYLFMVMVLASSGDRLFAQNIIISPNPICEGVPVNITINIATPGKVVAYYKFYFDYTNTTNGIQVKSATQNTSSFTMPPGNYTGHGLIMATDSTPFQTTDLAYTVYHNPIASFNLASNSKDTQCFSSNSFCFINGSSQNPLSPSNPLSSCTWLFGDGSQSNSCASPQCHQYGIINTYNVTLLVKDNLGCTATFINPASYQKGIVIVGTTPPDFKWTQLGPYNCFKTCYLFRNLSSLAIKKVQMYQWNFGDDSRYICNSYLEPDSNLYTAFGPLTGFMTHCDTVVHRYDSLQYDSIVHCYCQDGIFKPMLTIIDDHGCADSTRKTPGSLNAGVQLPYNINFTFDVTSTRAFPADTIIADSVCSSSGSICFKQTMISFAQPGTGDFIWDFGDPNDPTNRNLDSMTWTPCHAYSGMGSFFPSLKVKNICPDTTYYYYTATMVGPYRRFLDTTYDDQRDLIDGTVSYDGNTIPPGQIVNYLGAPGGPGFDGQALVLNRIDSVLLIFDTIVHDPLSNRDFAKYKMAYRKRYYGDTAYYFDTTSFQSPYNSSVLIPPDSIPVYQYYNRVPRTYNPNTGLTSNFFVPPPPPPGQTYQTLRDSIIPISFPTGLVPTASLSCLNQGGVYPHAYYFNSIYDKSRNIQRTMWYKFARSYNYGVRILGPAASIENPAIPVVINPAQKDQCGPTDTVDFVNTSGIGFKAHHVWRRWDFDDDYAPQCTSFSVPKHQLISFTANGVTKMVEAFPPIIALDSFAYYAPKSSNNDYLLLSDTLLYMYDTVRMWSNAIEQYMNSDHFFINNGVTYQGKRNCKFSHDTLPRHSYPNWDTVYLWYRYGHDFMPWKTTPAPGGFMFSRTGPFTSTTFGVKDWDTNWWGKPIYLNVLTGGWSLTQDSSWLTHYVDTIYIDTITVNGVLTNIARKTPPGKLKFIVRDTLPGIWVHWPRIDTLNQTLTAAKQTPNDIWPGNSNRGGLITRLVPDPFQLVLGGYFLINGPTVDTVVHNPSSTYSDKGQTFPLANGLTKLPGSNEDFFEYVFRRTIQRCLTVKLRLADSLNNRSADPGYPTDLRQLDIWDCSSDATVQLALGKPDARGLGKKGKECPGFDPTGYPALVFDDKAAGYPGTVLNCGRTSIWVDIDSLADRMDGTPCYLDAFTTWGTGVPGGPIAPGPGYNITPGGLSYPTFYTLMKFSLGPNPPSPWTGASTNILQYHVGVPGFSAPAADILQGYMTIGLYIGNGEKDSMLHIWASNYKTNTNNNGTPLQNWLGQLINPATGQPWTYQTIVLVDSVANAATPPPVPIPTGPFPPAWVDDSVAFVYNFGAVINKTPKIRFPGPPAVWDTLYDVQYLDPNWPRCISDTVWYHNFWKIKDLNPTFTKSPLELAVLRERLDTVMMVFQDSVQDSVQLVVWTWADNTATVDSFWYAGFDTTNDYYTNGYRRTRYELDLSSNDTIRDIFGGLIGYRPHVTDSILWPCGKFGERQRTQAMRFYKRYWNLVGIVNPNTYVLIDQCPVQAHPFWGSQFYSGNGASLPVTFNLALAYMKYLPNNYKLYFDSLGYNSGSGSIILKNKSIALGANVNINIVGADTIFLPSGYFNLIHKVGTIPIDTIVYQLNLSPIGLYPDSEYVPITFEMAPADTIVLPKNYKYYFDNVAFDAVTGKYVLQSSPKRGSILPQPVTIKVLTSDTARLDTQSIYYRNLLTYVGFIAPDTFVYKMKSVQENFAVNVHISKKDTTSLPANFRRLLAEVGFIAPDTLVMRPICSNPTHYDPQVFPYTNYFDTLIIQARDTMLYTQNRIIDTALMLLPTTHIYKKTSWEIAGRVPGATLTQYNLYLTNTKNCVYTVIDNITVGVIDTMHVFGGDGVEDTVFCKGENVHFVDSVRYFDFDNQLTNVPQQFYGRSRGGSYGPVIPYGAYFFDTTDFWARDASNPLDTLINPGGVLTQMQIEFRYFPGKWTNYDYNMTTGAVTYTPNLVPSAPLAGHWDAVLRSGNVSVAIPNSSSDPAFMKTFPGLVIYYPGGGGLAAPGIYVWDQFGGWYPAFPPVTIDSLNSDTDLTKLPGGIPTVGRTLIYNNGKGLFKQQGMFYWGGTQWVFICNNPYTSFPYFTHRLYWDFGDGSPIYMGVKPYHQYSNPGRYTVTMASRDSIGHFDTCIVHVEVMKPVVIPHLSNFVIGCKDTAGFYDSSYVLSGLNQVNTMDSVIQRRWWFTLRFSYPNGLQGQDTTIPNSPFKQNLWYYSQKGMYKIKLAVLTAQGCRDTTIDSIVVQGPRPMFKIITDTIGCKPFKVKVWNLADSIGMRAPSDTPTLLTVIKWGDGTQQNDTIRRDTIYHIYNDTGMYTISCFGSDSKTGTPYCPIAFYPDTTAGPFGGNQSPFHIYVKQPYKVKITTGNDTVCVGTPLDIHNLSDTNSYTKYRFERTKNDSGLTFIDSTIKVGNVTFTTHFDTAGRYKILLFPTEFKSTIAVTARCPSADTIIITALHPKSAFTIDTTAFPTYKFNNQSVAADYYLWIIYNKDSVTIKNGNGNGVVQYDMNPYTYDLGNDTGSYKVCLIAYKTIPNATTLCPDTSCSVINNIYQTHITIPNVFTPNGDGSNDNFRIDCENEIKFDLTIFNRWGTKVFVSTDKNNMWNGKDYNTGSDCAAGTYFYVFTYKLRGQDSDKTVHGTITLIRPQ